MVDIFHVKIKQIRCFNLILCHWGTVPYKNVSTVKVNFILSLSEFHDRDTSRKVKRRRGWKSGKSNQVSTLINPKHRFLRTDKTLITASHTHVQIPTVLCTYGQRDGLLSYEDVM